MIERLVHNAMLNYLSRAFQANKTDEICEKAVGLYDKDTIIKAKDTVWHYSNTSSRNVARQNIADNVLDMLKLIQLCETNWIKLPKFVIFDTTEVPTTPGELSAIVPQKVTEISNNLKDFIESEKKARAAEKLATSMNQLVTPPAKPSYAVLLKKPPLDLKKPDCRKAYLEHVCGEASGNIIELRPSRDAWKEVTKDKSGAESIMSRITGNNPEVEPKLQCPSFSVLSVMFLKICIKIAYSDLIANCLKATQIRNTRSFKFLFESKDDLESFIRFPPIIGYERLLISIFQRLPPQCFSCQSYGHFTSAWPGTQKCSGCGEAGHSTTKDNPCTKALKCALCNSSDHPCYTFKCPVTQSLLKNSNA